MCQADNGLKGEPVSHPSDAPQSDDCGEAQELIALALAIQTIRIIKDRVCGERFPHWRDPEAVTWSRYFIADQCDAVLPRLDAALSQSQIEERSDTDGAEE